MSKHINLPSECIADELRKQYGNWCYSSDAQIAFREALTIAHGESGMRAILGLEPEEPEDTGPLLGCPWCGYLPCEVKRDYRLMGSDEVEHTVECRSYHCSMSVGTKKCGSKGEARRIWQRRVRVTPRP